ncbi:RusA family crossover junction endodeoxyribonuclease [Bowmanella sp. JS7-9]|uniref:Crossover junction endodeoxyribonuclease rusA n=1 Tax=Pseudobowmanella zhangzhouensis TaxID=1537679 RepID=A0ABW1XN13_9ALTE|nr:RusA family crossover junction endodeoxyribonuclease [Bowmanella sp. JS7-9]
MKFNLPYPVSVNALYRMNKQTGRLYKTTAGKEYTKAVRLILSAAGIADIMLSGDLVISVTLMLPDTRRRDIDNLNKVLFDALVDARVIEDDEQFIGANLLKLRKGSYEGDPRVEVEIEKADLFATI